MKRIFSVVIFCLTINSGFASTLEDVSLLDVKHVKNNFELKLQVKNAPANSYFTVALVETDKEAFNKLALVLKKMKLKKNFKLNLNIPSFSATPSGSYYKSDSVTFMGTADEESLMN